MSSSEGRGRTVRRRFPSLGAEAFVSPTDRAALNNLQQMPLTMSPMWFLLRENVSLGGDVTVKSFKKAANSMLIGLVQSDHPDAGSVVLELGDKPMELRQWTITDSAGSEVRVGLYNAEFGLPLSGALFGTPRKQEKQK